MPGAPIHFLEQAQAQHPNIAADLAEFAELYEKKLWHELTVKLTESLGKPDFHHGDFLVQLYRNFVSNFLTRLNFLSLAKIAVAVAGSLPHPADAVAFLENEVVAKIVEAKLTRSEQPLLFLRMHIAQYKLVQGDLPGTKALIEAGKESLDSLPDVDPGVSAAVHYVSSLYYKAKKDFAEFYKSSLLYLAFVSSDKLEHEYKLSLAVDISLAALLGEGIYSFGELLLHPIITVLDGTPFAWLREMLEAFNAGDLHAYDALCEKHADALNGQPALVEHERALREKITILCLTELIFTLPAEERTISLQTIADRTKLNIDGAEFLLMKTLSLHLIEGVIDEVDSTVQVSWVQPRVLTLPQIKGLSGRLGTWIGKVNAAALTLEEESVGVAEL